MANAEQILSDVGKNSLEISCIATANLQIAWARTKNKSGLYLIIESARIYTIQNGYTINFFNLTLADEEYYVCGTISNNTLKIISSYFLYVRGI